MENPFKNMFKEKVLTPEDIERLKQERKNLLFQRKLSFAPRSPDVSMSGRQARAIGRSRDKDNARIEEIEKQLHKVGVETWELDKISGEDRY